MPLETAYSGTAGGSSPSDALSRALFRVDGIRAGRVLSLMPSGSLWEAMMPGADAGIALSVLGGGAARSIEAAVSALISAHPDALPAHLGLPFSFEGKIDPLEVAQLVLADAKWIEAGETVPTPTDDGRSVGGDPWETVIPGDIPGDRGRAEFFVDPDCWRMEILHRTRDDWRRIALACVDRAVLDALNGSVDPLEVLLFSEEGDMRGIVPFADAGTRERFMEAVPGAGDGCFAGYFRRSAAAALERSVLKSLEAVQGGWTGRDESGWPVWWRGRSFSFSAFSRLPPGVFDCAARVNIGIPRRFLS